jgi:hypothetical protein
MIVFAHAGVGLLDHDAVMFLMPLLPAMLVGTIILGAVLERRGVLGVAGRMVGANAPVAVIAASLSLAAAGIHFAVIESHLEESVLEAVLFFGLGWFQLIWAQLFLLRGGRSVALVGAAVNAGAIGVWLLSRTVGLPIGATPGVPEALGWPDLLASSFELSLIGLLLPLLLPQRFGRWFSGEVPVQKAFVLAAFSIAAVAVLTAVALVPDAFEALSFE